MRLALPGDTDDLYVRHQQVWAALRTQVREGRDFLYRMVSPRVVLVRSPLLTRGTVVSDVPPATVELDVVASDRVDRNKERAVARELIDSWTARLLLLHGLQAARVEVVRHGTAAGAKLARGADAGHLIRFGVATVRADVRVLDPSLARRAWRYGVGRGRRFGFGMLVPA